jgi:hypothetical protein
MTVGIAEVAKKRTERRQHIAKNGPDFLGRHTIPAVFGPKKTPWTIDHPHLARALLEEGVEHVLVSVVARLDHLDRTAFVTFMDKPAGCTRLTPRVIGAAMTPPPKNIQTDG